MTRIQVGIFRGCRRAPTAADIRRSFSEDARLREDNARLSRELSDALTEGAMVAQGTRHDPVCGSGYVCVRCRLERAMEALDVLAAAAKTASRYREALDLIVQCGDRQAVEIARKALEVTP